MSDVLRACIQQGQMSQEVEKWIRENIQLIERIRKRFEDYFQIQLNSRNSDCSNNGDEDGNPAKMDTDVSAKVENQWRKLDDLLTKEIPEKQKNVHFGISKKMDLLRTEALRIQNMFKNKFGEDKHNQFKLLAKTQSWKTPVFNSGLRKFQSQSTSLLKTPKYEAVANEEEGKVKSSIIEQPEEEEQEMIRSLEESERRSYSRVQQELVSKRRAQTCGIILTATLVLVILMSYIHIPMPGTFFSSLLDLNL